jgi:hypothetical protein
VRTIFTLTTSCTHNFLCKRYVHITYEKGKIIEWRKKEKGNKRRRENRWGPPTWGSAGPPLPVGRGIGRSGRPVAQLVLRLNFLLRSFYVSDFEIALSHPRALFRVFCFIFFIKGQARISLPRQRDYELSNFTVKFERKRKGNKSIRLHICRQRPPPSPVGGYTQGNHPLQDCKHHTSTV